MHIFIDESGLFLPPHRAASAWSTIGAFAVPDNQLDASSKILEKLREKLKCNEPKIESFKKHTDLLEFIEDVTHLNGTFFASAIERNAENAQFINQIIEADNKLEQGGKLIGNTQLLLQTNLLLELMNAAFWGILYRYSQSTPESSRTLIWRIDEKSKPLDNFVKNYTDKWFSGEGENYQYIYPIHPSRNHNLEFFEKSFVTNNAIRPAKLIGDLVFVNSKQSDGVQIAGILAGAIRRLLMGDWGEHQPLITRRLGKVMIKQPLTMKITGKKEDSFREKIIMPVISKLNPNQNHPVIEGLRKNACSIY